MSRELAGVNRVSMPPERDRTQDSEGFRYALLPYYAGGGTVPAPLRGSCDRLSLLTPGRSVIY